MMLVSSMCQRRCSRQGLLSFGACSRRILVNNSPRLPSLSIKLMVKPRLLWLERICLPSDFQAVHGSDTTVGDGYF